MFIFLMGWIIVLILLVFIIGLCLPKQRKVSRSDIFNTTPEILYKTVTNNEEWHYRSDLKDLQIKVRDGEYELWEETGLKGSVIHFQTKEKIPYSFYSFEMSSNIFIGYWTGEFEATEDGKTKFTSTEYIEIKNPFIRTLSYLLFDINKYLKNYQIDLHKKIDELE